jgi:hypothetical protein
MSKAQFLAWLEAGLIAFGGGVLGYLEPLITTGSLPPTADWKHIIESAALMGVAAVWQRFRPVPAAKAVTS